MGLSEEIVAAIRAKYIEGATYAELSAEAGVSAPYIRHILNGKRDPMKLSLDFFLRLFPSARIELAPARAQGDPAPASSVSLADYQDLREKYLNEKEENLNLREEISRLQSGVAAPPAHTMDGPLARAPYHAAPALSTSSPSNK